MDKYGIPQTVWRQTKDEMRNTLIACARDRQVLPYGKLVTLVHGIQFEAYDQRLFDMLGEISIEENAANRGMLSAVVVHKQGDMIPGPGFFDLARDLNKDVTDVDRCWLQELRQVWRYWSGREE